jgi:hypothetical protein
MLVVFFFRNVSLRRLVELAPLGFRSFPEFYFCIFALKLLEFCLPKAVFSNSLLGLLGVKPFIIGIPAEECLESLTIPRV